MSCVVDNVVVLILFLMAELIEFLLEFSLAHKGEDKLIASFYSLLYADTEVVRFLFPALNPLQRAYLSRLALVGRPVQEAVLKHWTTSLSSPLHAKSVKDLENMNMLKLESGQVQINESLQSTILQILHGGSSGFFEVTQKPGNLNSNFDEIWTAVLSRILGGEELKVTPEVEEIIGTLRLSTAGAFRFVLQPRKQQLWQIIRHALTLVEVRLGSLELCSSVRLLCAILSLPRSSACTSLSFTESSSPGVSQFLSLLEGLGVINTNPISASGGLAAMRGETELNLLAGANLVVDSNLHLTGYTTNPLQLRIIGLFAEVRRQLGSAVAAVITRKSVLRATECGVSAARVIEFLKSNSHQVTKAQVPSNVTMQLKLWEGDAIHNRMRVIPAIHISWDRAGSESSMQEYRRVKELAQATGALLCLKETSDKQILVLDKGKAEQLQIVPVS